MVIFTKFITLKNGKRIAAESYGIKAFRFEITPEKQEEYQEKKANKAKKAKKSKKDN